MPGHVEPGVPDHGLHHRDELGRERLLVIPVRTCAGLPLGQYDQAIGRKQSEAVGSSQATGAKLRKQSAMTALREIR